MATTTNITTTFAGEAAAKFISAALTSGVTLNNGSITIEPNVRYKKVLRTLDTNAIVTDATCDFTPTSTVTLGEQVLEPKELQTNLQLCKKDFADTWSAMEMGYSAHLETPDTLAEYVLGYVAAKIAETIELNLWSGDDSAGSGNNLFEGFEQRITSSALAGVGGTSIDSSNVITFLGKVVDGIPSAVYGKEDLKIWLPNNVYQSYIRALGGFAAAGVGANGFDNKGTQFYTMGAGLTYEGIPVMRAAGMSADRAIVGQTSNLFFGTGLFQEDMNEVKLIDTSETLGDQNLRIVARFTAGTQVGTVADAKHFTPAS
jgi:hypothetical protein